MAHKRAMTAAIMRCVRLDPQSAWKVVFIELLKNCITLAVSISCIVMPFEKQIFLCTFGSLHQVSFKLIDKPKKYKKALAFACFP